MFVNGFSRTLFWCLVVGVLLYTITVIRRYYRTGVSILSAVVGTVEKLS